jgi:hypothetical protein
MWHSAFLPPVLVYLVLAAALLETARDAVNPDAVAYIQNARHWAAGRADLAVASHWGPMLSWLLVPAIWLGVDPLLTLKALAVVWGLGFAACAARLTRALTGGWWQLAAFSAGLLLALTMLPGPVTPDMLLTFVTTLYFCLSIRLLGKATPSLALAVGVVGGVAYLIKGYALPFVVAHLLLTAVLRWRLVKRVRSAKCVVRSEEEETTGAFSREPQASASRVEPAIKEPPSPYPLPSRERGEEEAAPEKAGKPGPREASSVVLLGVALFGLFAVAWPWAAVISRQEGHFTFSSSGGHTRIWCPILHPDPRPFPFVPVQLPRAGRLTVWENPSECPLPWPTWSPLDGTRGLENQLETIWGLTAKALACLKELDSAGVLLAGLLGGGLLTLLLNRWRMGGDDTQCRRRWVWLSVIIYIGGYVLVGVESRLLWPVTGMIVALGLETVWTLSRVDLRHGGLKAGADPAVAAGRAFRRACVAALLASLLYSVLLAGQQWRRFDGPGAKATWLKTASRSLLPLDARARTAVVANEWHAGLHATYWSDNVFLGQFDGSGPEAVAAELAPVWRGQPICVLVFNNDELADRLSGSDGFRKLAKSVAPGGGESMSVFEYAKPK